MIILMYTIVFKEVHFLFLIACAVSLSSYNCNFVFCSSSPDVITFNAVQFSCSVVSDSLQPHKPQQARPPCPSPIPGVHPNPCPVCQRCHPTISYSVVPFNSCLRSFPASGSFQMSQFFTSGGQHQSFQ